MPKQPQTDTSSRTFQWLYFLEKLSFLIAIFHDKININYIPGRYNDLADALNRWNGLGDPSHKFLSLDRFPLIFTNLWNLDRESLMTPADAKIRWKFPM